MINSAGGASRSYDALLGLGSNVGDKAGNIATALRLLTADGEVRIVGQSRLFRSAPWGVTEQAWFVNAVAAVATGLSAHALLARCLAVETEMGRVRRQKWGPRLVDVDVLTYRGETIDTPDLKVPHPLIEQRGFVVVPLMDVAPDEVIRGRRVRDLAPAFQGGDVAPLTGS